MKLTQHAPAPLLAHSTEDVAAMLGIKKGTVYKKLRDGELKAIKIGRRTVIADDEVRRWFAEQPAFVSGSYPVNGGRGRPKKTSTL